MEYKQKIYIFLLLIAFITSNVTAISTIVNITTIADVGINLYYPNDIYGASDHIYIGEGTPDNYWNGYFNFSYGLPINTIINSANIYAYEYSGGNTAGFFDIYPITSPWVESTVTWNTKPSTGAFIEYKYGLADPGWMNWNVTSAVQSQVNTPSTAHGFAIWNDISSPDIILGIHSKEYGSLKPYISLNVTYYPLTPIYNHSTLIDNELFVYWQPNRTGAFVDIYYIHVTSPIDAWFTQPDNGIYDVGDYETVLIGQWLNATVYAHNTTSDINSTPLQINVARNYTFNSPVLINTSQYSINNTYSKITTYFAPNNTNDNISTDSYNIFYLTNNTWVYNTSINYTIENVLIGSGSTLKIWARNNTYSVISNVLDIYTPSVGIPYSPIYNHVTLIDNELFTYWQPNRTGFFTDQYYIHETSPIDNWLIASENGIYDVGDYVTVLPGEWSNLTILAHNNSYNTNSTPLQISTLRNFTFNAPILLNVIQTPYNLTHTQLNTFVLSNNSTINIDSYNVFFLTNDTWAYNITNISEIIQIGSWSTLRIWARNNTYSILSNYINISTQAKSFPLIPLLLNVTQTGNFTHTWIDTRFNPNTSNDATDSFNIYAESDNSWVYGYTGYNVYSYIASELIPIGSWSNLTIYAHNDTYNTNSTSLQVNTQAVNTVYPPNITGLYNNYTFWNQINLTLNISSSVFFNVTIDNSDLYIIWKINNSNVKNSSDLYFIKTFDSEGVYNLTVQAANSAGSGTLKYIIITVIDPGGSEILGGGSQYYIRYTQNCISQSGLITPSINSLFRTIALVLFIVLLIIILRITQENFILGLIVTTFLIIVLGSFLPLILDSIDGISCIYTDSINIQGLQNTWIALSHSNITSGSQTLTNTTYTGINNTDYLMDFINGRIKPLSTGGLNFNN